MEQKGLPHAHPCAVSFDHMPQLHEFAVASDIFKLLADSTRVRLFWVLCHCGMCVTNLSALMEMSSPAISHHLKLLKACNLVTSQRIGKEMHYKAADTQQAQALHQMIETVVRISCPGGKKE